MGENSDGYASKSGGDALLDREQIDSLVAAAGVDGTWEILDAFRRSTDDLLAKLHVELASGDLAEAARTAHALKGSAANVGALTLSSAARKVEDACRSQNGAGAQESLAGAGSHFEATLAAFKAVLDAA